MSDAHALQIIGAARAAPLPTPMLFNVNVSEKKQCSISERVKFNVYLVKLVLQVFGLWHPYHYGLSKYRLKKDTEISRQLKHLISLTPIDRYSFKKAMFKIPVSYDFTLASYA